MAAPDPLHLFRLLAVGEISAARLYFSDVPTVADPIEGVAADDAAWQRFAQAKSAWLREHRARVQQLAVTQANGRVIAEATLYLRHGGRTLPLPLAVAADVAGDRWRAMRIYHSTWPLTASHQVRPPVLPSRPGLALPDVVGRYHHALRAGDLEAVLATFGPSGYAREPSGGDHVYQGPERLRQFYGAILPRGTGVSLDYCTVTDDGVRAALEYTCVAWAGTALPPQAGVAVYERGPSGLLSAARIYDDVKPPL